eukprot:c24593_g1_i1 orf=327-2879(-)
METNSKQSMIRGGVNLVERRPVFSADGKTLLVCTGCSISVYSVATGLLVSRLQGHNAAVTSVTVVRYAGAADAVVSRAWSSSLDGTIKFWDVSNGTVIKSINIGRPIFSMAVPKLCKPFTVSQKRQQLVAFLLIQWKTDMCDNEVHDKGSMQNGKLDQGVRIKKVKNILANDLSTRSWRVLLHDLTNNKPLPGHLAKALYPNVLVAGPLGGLVGIVDNRKIWVWRVSDRSLILAKDVEATILHHTKTFQDLAFDPTETMVAGGDATGRILIWKNVGERSFASVAQRNAWDMGKKQNNVEMSGVRGHDDAAALTTYHWHADRVNFLLFSADGAYLFSGGKEAVLVLWQLETGKQQFLPRLGSSLLFIASSSDPSFFSISFADNTIKFINTGTMTVERSIRGIKPPVPLTEQGRGFELTGVAVHPQSGNIVLPSDNLSLQFYDLFYDRHIVEVQISPKNYIPNTVNTKDKIEESGTPVALITHVTFSMDGSVMATIELQLPEEGVGGGSCLKFWSQSSSKLQFSLNTQVVDPHSAEVSGLAYHPVSDMAVTCSQAGDFKVWVQGESRRQNQESLYLPSWRCQSVGTYQQKRMSCVAFSPDGSLLAVAAEELITFWNPNTNGLLCVLASSPTQQQIRTLSFIPNTNHLITTSWGGRPMLTVWSLETLSIHWSYHVKVEGIAVDSRNPHFAILAPSMQGIAMDKGKKMHMHHVIAIFSVDDPFPTAIWNVCDATGGNLYFVPLVGEGSESQSMLMFMNLSREYILFNPCIKDDKLVIHPNDESITAQEPGPSAFQAIYGKVAVQKSVNKEFAGLNGNLPLENLFKAPSHVLPSLSQIGFTFLESLLEKAKIDNL